jgi:Rrf2 family protein
MHSSDSNPPKKRGRGTKSKMQILAATEDAIRTLLYLAMEGEGRKVSGQEICRTQEITSAFLIKVTRPLVKKGLLSATRGVGGGFKLARPPEKITLLEIVETIQGPLVFNECLLGPGTCERDLNCPVHPVWKQIRKSTENILAGWSLADLVASGRARGVPWERIHL